MCEIGGTDIDALCTKLTLAPRTMHLLHAIAANPVADAEKPAGADDEQVGIVLDEQPLADLVAGFTGSSIMGS